MSGVLILTISGQDRAGLVEKLADLIAAHGANRQHCRLVPLGAGVDPLADPLVDPLVGQ